MMASVIMPYADCRYDPDQNFDELALTIAVITGGILGAAMLSNVYGSKKKSIEFPPQNSGRSWLHATIGTSRQRFSLLIFGSLLFALPFLVIVHQAITSMSSEIYSVRKQLCGARHHGVLMLLMERLQELQGITFSARNGDTVAAASREAKKEEVRQALVAADRLSESCGTTPVFRQDWQKVAKAIAALLEEQTARPPFDEFVHASEDIHLLMQFMGFVSDSSRFTVGPDTDTDYLVGVMVNVTPLLMETLGKMGGLTSGLLASKVEPLDWAAERRGELEALHSQLITLHSQLIIQREDILDGLQRAKRANNRAAPLLDYYNSIVEIKYGAFNEPFKSIVLGGRAGMSSSELFHLATDSVAAYAGLYKNISDHFLDILRQREEESTFERSLVLYSSGISSLGFIVLFILLYRNLVTLEESKEKIEHEAKTITLLRRVAESLVRMAVKLIGAGNAKRIRPFIALFLMHRAHDHLIHPFWHIGKHDIMHVVLRFRNVTVSPGWMVRLSGEK